MMTSSPIHSLTFLGYILSPSLLDHSLSDPPFEVTISSNHHQIIMTSSSQTLVRTHA